MNSCNPSRAMMPCQPTHRLFFALQPPPAAAPFIQDCCAWLGRGKWVRPEHLHVTLNILDDWPFLPSHLLEAMVAAGDRIAFAPFRIVLDQLSGSNLSVVLRPTERLAVLYRFQQQLAEALAHSGVRTREDVRFSPHLTVRRPGRHPFVEAVDPVSWTVESFVLIESLVGWTRHVVHWTWPLGERAS